MSQRFRRASRGWPALLAVACALAGCGDDAGGTDPMGTVDARPGGGDGASPGEGEPPGLVGITELHNDVRATVDVGPLVWDPELAAVAQAWADSCTDDDPPMGLIDHNDGRSDDYPGYVGENVYGSSGSVGPDGAVSAWASEGEDYDHASNSCRQGRICGHYTQIVWAASERLGCGLASCPGLTYRNTIVCNYSPGGNDGGRPY